MNALPLPAWPDPSTEEGKVFFANAVLIFNTWKSFGVSNQFAFGMLAQAEAETSDNPKAKGDYVLGGKKLPWSAHPVGTPTSFGLYEWKEGRIALIKARTGIDIMTFPPIPDQCRAAWWELCTFPNYGKAEIEAASTAFGAGYQAAITFEKAGAADAARRRGQMAERWVAHWVTIVGP